MSEPSAYEHVTVLLDETVDAVHPRDGGVYVDCTLGGGGHTEALLARASCTVVGIDRDPAALSAARLRNQAAGDRFIPVRASFSDLAAVLDKLGIARVDGVLADLGVSSPQLDEAERGFSFRFPGPLDMRMDPDGPVTAATVVNTWPEAELQRIIRDYGEERKWRRVASRIVEGRPWTTTTQLADAVGRVVGRGKGRINPATRTFQGIRIAVNDELGELERLLAVATDHLAPGGWLAVISFHSLEDRLVKQFMARESGKNAERDAYGNKIGSFRLDRPVKPITPAPDDPNPRARSARLRSAQRLEWTPSQSQ